MSTTIDQKHQMADGLLTEADALHQRIQRIRADRTHLEAPLPTDLTERREEIRSRTEHARTQEHQIAAITQERAFLIAWADEILVEASLSLPQALREEHTERDTQHPLDRPQHRLSA